MYITVLVWIMRRSLLLDRCLNRRARWSSYMFAPDDLNSPYMLTIPWWPLVPSLLWLHELLP